MPTELNDLVHAVLQQLVDTGQELGLQAAAYLDGRLVVDTWAGVADPATGRPVDGDTLFTSWSTTKGWTATCLHLLAHRGQVDYDAPIARYWPEFAAQGKGRATVRHALTHATGVPQLPPQTTPELICDWAAMTAAIAALKPLWTPGTKVGYHAWTFGWIIGEIVHRADGRPLAQFAREELCQPLGITDFYLGIPDEAEPRVAPLRQEPPTGHQSDLDALAAPRRLTNADVLNRPEVRRASVPGAGGIMNARAIARHYALLAQGGDLDGARLFSPERIDQMRAVQTAARDEVFQAVHRKALGYMVGGEERVGGKRAMGASAHAFGHDGLGGSLGFADPERRLAFGLTKNLLKANVPWDQAAAFRAAEALRAALDAR
jgi:CubicO group peptidase (beta-lactamase class C family)